MPDPSSTSSPHPLPEEIKNLLADVETFVADILRGENLSKKAKEKRESLIKKIKDVKSTYLQEFQDKGDAEDGEEYDDPLAGTPDTISLASERYDKDDEGPSDGDAEDGEEYDDPLAGTPDTISLASERYDKDDEGPSDGEEGGKGDGAKALSPHLRALGSLGMGTFGSDLVVVMVVDSGGQGCGLQVLPSSLDPVNE
ncbi:PREDICTED: src kinase-associated phosphoprotein 2-like [Galeopterus variegatus]|uniref:Src kinase-associated phosphoprotein 2-like n=1 Tax=Galeopterus variegatus TaxID=482537 RepID=A0ABM0QDN3_GALVR|nr:PREDICTED: src kinase-associated phosphoprotein 2-like [Galeopterus variegatus]